MAGPTGIEPVSPSSKHGILSIVLKTRCLGALTQNRTANYGLQNRRYTI